MFSLPAMTPPDSAGHAAGTPIFDELNAAFCPATVLEGDILAARSVPPPGLVEVIETVITVERTVEYLHA